MNPTASGAEQARRNVPLLRMAAFAVAIALGVAGIWMIVTGSSPKGVRIGAIASLWALLLGAFAVLGSRVPARDSGHPSEPAELAAPLAPLPYSGELAGLRSEVTALRNELVELVGGQLRLERIEAARLIGPELEALQHEVRQLRFAGMEAEATLATRMAHPLAARAGGDQEVHDAEIVVERVHPLAEPEPPAVRPEPQPAPEPAHQEGPAAARGSAADGPFAGLPRITPFTEFALDPIPSTVDEGDRSGGGRRRRADDSDNDVLARILARELGR